ncbi:MAG: hypothetical protein KatS3mg110_1409 [Pirellulaceae bacterium]|nr:MAG: hypothetical protein KatS3mg110_1409 [Pirellulaceae bacterium]
MDPPLIQLGEMRRTMEGCVERANAFLVAHGQEPVELADREHLRLVLMGEFNAGKSTLVNALLGEEAAPRGPVPTTRAASEYDYRGLRIIDVPGTNARLSELQTARRALQTAHAVLYVATAQSGLDYKEFWQDLEQLINADKPFFVIVNDKQVYGSTQEATLRKQQVLDRFTERVREKFPHERIEARTFWINAEYARRVRAGGLAPQDNPLYLQFLDFERELLRVLRENDAYLRQTGKLELVLERLETVRSEARARLESSQVNRYEELVDECNATRGRVLAELEKELLAVQIQAEKRITLVEIDLADERWQRELAKDLDRLVENAARRIADCTKLQVTRLQHKVEAAGLRVSMGTVAPPQSDLVAVTTGTSHGQRLNTWQPQVASPLKISTNMIQKGLGIGMVREIMIPLTRVKGLAPWFRGFITSFMKWAPVFGVVWTLCDMFAGWQKQREEQAKAIRWAEAFIERILHQVQDAIRSLRQRGVLWVDTVMEPLFVAVDQARTSCHDRNQKAQQTALEAETLAREINVLRSCFIQEFRESV